MCIPPVTLLHLQSLCCCLTSMYIFTLENHTLPAVLYLSSSVFYFSPNYICRFVCNCLFALCLLASLCVFTFLLVNHPPPCVDPLPRTYFLVIIIRLGNEIIAATLLGIRLNQVLIFLIYIPHPTHRRPSSIFVAPWFCNKAKILKCRTNTNSSLSKELKLVKPKLRQKKVAEVKRIRKARGLK